VSIKDGSSPLGTPGSLLEPNLSGATGRLDAELEGEEELKDSAAGDAAEG